MQPCYRITSLCPGLLQLQKGWQGELTRHSKDECNGGSPAAPRKRKKTQLLLVGLLSLWLHSLPVQPLARLPSSQPRNSMSSSRKTRGEGEMQIKIERNVDCIVTASIKLRHFSLMSQQQWQEGTENKSNCSANQFISPTNVESTELPNQSLW